MFYVLISSSLLYKTEVSTYECTILKKAMLYNKMDVPIYQMAMPIL